MPLAAGTRLGPYEIHSAIGAGGMGEVYRARDTRLERIVAIKVLTAHLAQDPQFLERFVREAKSISALNHPNICTLFDIGESDGGIRYLVLEYLEGETLAARIAKGPLPVTDALKIAVEIASALDKAHRLGIVHRDLKPGNVMLTKTGSKLLDFGLAGFSKPVTGSAVAAVANSEMPTVTAALTARGTILGTFQYMAPEQIEGEPADARSDLFAFGAVLFEMLTGKRAFEGKSHAGLLSAIIRDEPPPVSQVQPLTPPALDLVIRTCLVKSPEDRYQSAHDLWVNLRWIGEGGTGGSRADVGVRRQEAVSTWAWIAAFVALAIGVALSWWLKPSPPVTHVVTRFSYPLPDGQNFTRTGRHNFALSPDGTKLVYVANEQLYLRALDQLEAQSIRGSNEDPMEPLFSPDGQWLAYFVPANGNGPSEGRPFVLKKIALAGGAPITVGQLPGAPFGATWRNGMIAFGISTVGVAAVQSLPESGGTLQTLVTIDPTHGRLTQPQLMADGKHLLFVSMHRNSGAEGEIQVQTLNGNGKDRRVLVTGGTDPRVLPTGQLVYVHDATLLAVPFDIDHLAVTGAPIPVVEGVTETSTTAAGQFAVSSDGSLAFRPGAKTTAQRTLVWVDREGHEQPIPATPRNYLYPRVSPDGAKIAVGSRDEEDDVWVFDLAKETLTRLTFGATYEPYAAWTPDNKYLLFSSGPMALAPGTRWDLFRKAADGTGPAEALTQNLTGGTDQSVSPDGKYLVYARSDASASQVGIFLLPLNPKGEPRALLADPKFSQHNGEISPDGHWIAYYSNESGRYEIYVRPFPAVDSGRWQISSGGGREPLWSRSGRELFFLNNAKRMTVVSVAAGSAVASGSALASGSAFAFGKPQTLFDATIYLSGTAPGRRFDISPDGKRFLMARDVIADNTTEHPSIVIVSHWFDEMKARMAGPR